MAASPRLLLSLLCLLLVACTTRRVQEDDDDDDSAQDDDDSAQDDDDSTPTDDDDATGSALSPEIIEITVCQQTVVLGSYARFAVEVSDAQEDMHAPVTYRVQIDTAANTTFDWDEELGGHGVIDHTVQLLQGNLVRGSEHNFTFTVIDDEGNASTPVSLTWTIPLDANAEPCE